MKLFVEWLELTPQALNFSFHLVSRHVVVRQPHFADIIETEVARALVRNFDHARVVVAHGCGDLVPLGPHLFEAGRIALGAHQGFEFIQRNLTALIVDAAGRVA